MQEQQLFNQMIALSRKKLVMLQELKKLSEGQNKAFRDKMLDGIEKILDEKDAIIANVQKLDEAFLGTSESIKKQLAIDSLEDLSGTNLEGRLELKELIQQISALVESVIQLEQDGYDNASELKKEAGERIKGVNTGKKITTAYTTKPTSAPSYFFDKKK